MRFRFGEFELDPDAFELCRAGEPVHVEPQVFAVLACLVERHDRLVSRDELLDVVWGHRFVTDATVASRVKTARRAIGDDGLAQRLIRTVTGRGYRFVGAVEVDGGARAARPAAADPPARAADALQLVGREDELAALDGHLAAAEEGAARVVLVTGEAGSGKTTLVEAFRGGLGRGRRVWMGHCLPIAGGAEPYWPVLDALSAAAKDDEAVVAALARRAPAWLAELPLPLPPEVAGALPPATSPATQGRFVREFLAALDALCADQAVVLVVEDLHWADEATLGLLEALARRGSHASLLLIATVRPGEERARQRPVDALVHELTARRLAHEVPVAALGPAAVETYVRARVGADAPPWLPGLLTERTGGNPLFLECLLESWLAEGRLAAGGAGIAVPDRTELAQDVPTEVRRLVGAQLDELEPRVRLALEGASVAGVRFAAADAAAAADLPVADVDDALAALATAGRIVRTASEPAWLDAIPSGRYAFAHELYRDSVYERLSASRRARMHAAVGRRLEEAYGHAGAHHFAAQLGHHFANAGDAEKGVRYLRAAAEQSLARSAHAEAAQQAEQALELLAQASGAADAAEAEISLRSIWAAAQIALRGWAAPEIEAAYERSRVLCEARGDDDALASVVYALAILHEYRGEYELSGALLSQHLERGSDTLVPEALELLACSTFHQGQFSRSLELAERGLADYDPSLATEYLARLGESPAVRYHCWAALALWFLGREGESLDHLGAALAEAQAHAYSQTTAQAQAAFLHQYRRDAAETRRWADTTIAISTEHGFPFRVAQATILRGWARAAEGALGDGADELDRGLALYRESGAGMDVPYYLGLAAEVAAWRGRLHEARARVVEARALLPARGFFYDAPLLRLEALLRAEAGDAAAVPRLEEALAVAAAQGAARLETELGALLERARRGERIGVGDLGRPTSGTTAA